MKKENLNKVRSILCEVLELESDNNIETLTQNDTKKWDSLAQVSILSALEAEFSIDIDAEEYENLNSYQSIIDLLYKLKL